MSFVKQGDNQPITTILEMPDLDLEANEVLEQTKKTIAEKNSTKDNLTREEK